MLYLLRWGEQKFNAMKLPRFCPLVLLVKVGCSNVEHWERKKVR